MSKARELSELGDKITVDGSGNSTFDGDVSAANLSTTGNVTVSGTVDGRDVAADGSKLDGIEAGADVTDTANVTAAGALMDSEVTNLAAVKAFDPTDYATAAQGTLADSAVQPNDSPSFAGLTVDTNTLYVDSTNNRVGIGTTSPSDVLHIDGSSSTDGILIKNPLSGSFYNAKLEFIRDTTAGGAKIQTERNAAGGVGLSFSYTSSNANEVSGTYSEAMRITSSGSVGIGTSSPDQALSVVGKMSFKTGTTTRGLIGSPSWDGSYVSLQNGTLAESAGNAALYQSSLGQTSLNAASGQSVSFKIANGEKMRIDSSGNLLVGKTSQSDGATAGHELLSDGRFYHTKSGDHVGRLNRLSTDGDILRFAKDGSTVGSIGSYFGDLFIASPSSTDAGLGFGASNIRPVTTTGAYRDAAIDLGASTGRFKNLYLSGSISDGTNSKTVAQLAASAAYDAATSSTGFFALPSGTTAQRPSSPANGYIRYNSTIGGLEEYRGGAWHTLSQLFTGASGGSVTTSGSYTIHTFTSSGTFTVSGGAVNVEYLVIGGGGGGATQASSNNRGGGGGGAGGYRTNVSGQTSGGNSSAEGTKTLGVGSYTVTVGGGGAGGSGGYYVYGSSGNNSVFDSITSNGGGRGGHGNGGGPASGGSGGGGGSGDNPTNGASGTSGQGFGGGNGVSSGSYTGGTGGGAGGAGTNAQSGVGIRRAGGAGLSSNITGSSVTRAVGGGSLNGDNEQSGGANTGTGGDGGGGTSAGSGGSGIVIIRYLTP